MLDRIEVGGAYAGLVAEAPDADGDARAERQATEYVQGVTRLRRYLDFLLAHAYRGRLDKMEPTLRQILRVGLYDLLYLDTPPHAAVNEAVELARRLVRPKAAGLVNGILRTLLRQKDALPVPATGDRAEDLALLHSHPTWMVRRWLDRLGEAETVALLRWNNARPSFGLRLDRPAAPGETAGGLLDAHDIPWQPSPYLDDFVRVDRLQPVIRAGLLGKGPLAVQDESAGLVVRLLDPQPGETVLDVCAAPGGKVRYAALRMKGEGHLHAYDLSATRLRLVARAAERQGLPIHTEAADLRALAARPDAPTGDRVLLDAPCSGLGVLAKRADLRWNRTPEELAERTALQDELLTAAARLVHPGGLLVYATCSIAPEENAARVEAFLARHPGFARETARGLVPEAMVTPAGDFASFPHRHGIDGAFAARLRRTAPEDPSGGNAGG